MLAALAFAAVTFIGVSACELGHEPKSRARSGPGVALSVFTLGALIARSARRLAIHFHAVWRQPKKARRRIQRVFPAITPLQSGGRNVRLPQSHALYGVDCGWKGRRWG